MTSFELLGIKIWLTVLHMVSTGCLHAWNGGKTVYCKLRRMMLIQILLVFRGCAHGGRTQIPRIHIRLTTAYFDEEYVLGLPTHSSATSLLDSTHWRSSSHCTGSTVAVELQYYHYHVLLRAHVANIPNYYYSY